MATSRADQPGGEKDGTAIEDTPKHGDQRRNRRRNKQQAGEMETTHLIPSGASLQSLRPFCRAALHECWLRLRHNCSSAPVTHGLSLHCRCGGLRLSALAARCLLAGRATTPPRLVYSSCGMRPPPAPFVGATKHATLTRTARVY